MDWSPSNIQIYKKSGRQQKDFLIKDSGKMLKKD